MGSQRDQEMQRGRNDGQGARGSAFDCSPCKRPQECPDLPTVAEDGRTRLRDSEVLEIYNLRRYEHYLEDFADVGELRDHLVSRARYWALDDARLLADHLASIDATVAWWLIAHRRQVEDEQRAQGRLTV